MAQMEHLSKFTALSHRDKWLMLPIAGGIFIARFLLWTILYRTVLDLHERSFKLFTRRFGLAPDQADYTERVVRIVSGIGRRVLGSKPCLPQALVTQWFLRRNGFDAMLRIGVNKDKSGELLAHAWVESSGDIIIGGRLSRYRYERIEPVLGDDSGSKQKELPRDVAQN